MGVDISRAQDLEDLYKERAQAPNRYRRDQLDDVIKKIMNESPTLRRYRVDLIKALQTNDTRYIHYIQEKIVYLRKNETGGKDI